MEAAPFFGLKISDEFYEKVRSNVCTPLKSKNTFKYLLKFLTFLENDLPVAEFDEIFAWALPNILPRDLATVCNIIRRLVTPVFVKIK